MRSVGLKVLKNRLSEYVRIAASGETVLITDRDRIVAEISPPSQDRGTGASAALLADAIQKGWITPPSLPLEALPDRKPVATLGDILADLDASRGDR